MRRCARHLIAVSLCCFASALLVACAADAPIAVAPEIQLEPVATAEPTIELLEALPAVEAARLPTLDAAPTLETAPTAADQNFGAIINRDYEPPPTSTPRPTAIPTATPIVIPPTQPGSAHTTAIPVDHARLDSARMGIQAHYNFDVPGWERTLQQAAALRVDWFKIQANWSWLQPNGAGQFDANFRMFQFHIQAADKHGFKILLSIAKAPDWTRQTDRGEDGPPDDLSHLKWFIHTLLEKVGPYIDAIEIWNEPNLKREWTGNRPISGASYMELFRVGHDAIRAVSPTLAIVTAGLAPTGNLAGVSVNDRDFLRQMYQAGLGAYRDVKIGVHPYGWGNPPDFVCCDNVAGQGWDDRPQFFFLQTIGDYRGIISAFNHNAPMWVTEFGWATWEDYPTEAPDIWMAYNSAIDQRDYTLRAFQIGQSRADIEVMILWNLSYANEIAVSQRSELAAYSLLYPRFDGSGHQRERPLFNALATRP